MALVKCSDCKFKDNQDSKKYCHRYPPVVRPANPAGVGNETCFPEVQGSWSCGEGVLKEV
jgi:hypothetical protein